MNQDLLKNNYLIVKNFLHKDTASDLYRELVDNGQQELHFVNDDFHGPCYNYQSPQAGKEFLYYFTRDMSDIAQERLFPTYAYLRLYKKDSFLIAHTDRPACEISVTIHLGSDQEWSLGLRNYITQEQYKVDLEPGDAVVYLGCVTPHWRVGNYQGENFGQMFLHYVRSRGPLAYCANDIDRTKPDGQWEDRLRENYATL
jgi:alkylated DNA repair dioxygenase AlkB|tara:strand:- start:3137 stop:3736 length:600 start_codon:yes stop_codon:yes gene_type:complete